MPNQYKNKVVYNGTTLIDLTSDTVTADKLLEGYTAHDRSGALIVGTATSGGGGAVYQDQDGYLVLSDQGGGSSVIVDPLSVTTNGTYTAPTGHAYSPVTVNVGGGVEPTPWVRPSEWPDLSQMDVSAGDILYMTSCADEARGFCSFTVNCTGSYTVEVGSINGSTFTADSTQSYTSGTYCQLYYGTSLGGYKVFRVTGTSITKLSLRSGNALTIDGHACYTNNQGIIDVVGKLPSGTSVSCGSQYNIVNVDISGLRLSGSISSMFANCYSLTSLGVSDWDTSDVTSMTTMFTNCYSLTYLDVSDWDTSSVNSMSSMFNTCTSLTFLDVSNWNTSSATDMYGMFSACYSLTSLDVSGWDTSGVTSMSSMFNNCNSLTYLDVSGWDTSSVKTMQSMFNNCYSLTHLDVSGWDTSSVTIMTSMFSYCKSLTSLDASDWDTSSATNMSSMFNGCNSLISIGVSGWDTSSVENMQNMFNGCYSLTYLDVSGWDTSSVTIMSGMFNGCSSLISLDVSGWDTSSVTNMGSMFTNCNSLTSIDVSGFDFSKVTTATTSGSIFYYCYGLHGSLTLPSSMGMIGNSCFANCRSLTEWHFLATTPPTLNSANAFTNMTDYGGKKIYVPAASLSAYQTAANWSTYASYMVGE